MRPPFSGNPQTNTNHLKAGWRGARIRFCSSKSAARSAEKPSIIVACTLISKQHLMSPPLAVLDTNVVLDWFVFANPAIGPLAAAIETGAVAWLSCPPMRAELAHVLGHARLGGFAFDAEQVLTSVDRASRMAEPPRPCPISRHRCSDPSDQMFIDLALAQGARWLITRDRALLKLARKVSPLGLLVQPPESWREEQGVR